LGVALIILSVITIVSVQLVPGLFSGVLILVNLGVLLVLGAFFLVTGLWLRPLNRPEASPEKSKMPFTLTALDMVILRMVSEKKSQEDIEKSTGVSPAILAEKSASLTSNGYLSGAYLTEKGFDVLRTSKTKTV